LLNTFLTRKSLIIESGVTYEIFSRKESLMIKR
jgi:hypothetical protein